MKLSEFQAEVGLIARIPTSHPMYTQFITPASGSEDQSVINRAANKFVAYAVGGNASGMDLFPELRNAWTMGPTIATDNSYAMPVDAVVVQHLSCAHQSTLPNWNTTKEFPMNYMPPVTFGNLTKDSTVSNYASVWSKISKNILYWPTADSTTIDYHRLYGLKIEAALVNAGDTFVMQPIWHDFVAVLAAQMLSIKLGWYEQAQALWGQFKEDLAGTMNVMAMEQHGVVLGRDDRFNSYAVSGR